MIKASLTGMTENYMKLVYLKDTLEKIQIKKNSPHVISMI